jgi:hypothetical protein
MAAVDGKVAQFVWGNAIHFVEGFGFDATEAGAIVVDFAVAIGVVEVNAPAVITHQTKILLQLIGVEVDIEVGALGWL